MIKTCRSLPSLLRVLSVVAVALLSCGVPNDTGAGSSSAVDRFGAPQGAPSPSPPPGYVPEPPFVDWDNPIGGEEVATIEDAASRLPFEVYKPRNLPRPMKVLASPESYERPGRALALLFRHPAYGRIALLEHLPDVPADRYIASYQEVIDRSDEPTFYGTAEFVSIRDGETAFLTTAPDGSRSSIFWLEGDVELVIRGPSLSRDAAIEIANQI